MNPSQALKTDWRLYYHNTFMQNEDEVVLVTCGRTGPAQAHPGGGFRARLRDVPIDEEPPEEEEEEGMDVEYHEDNDIRLGPPRILDENVDFWYRTKAQGEQEPVSAEKLRLWWPRAGAYNAVGFAAYIGRRARRSMKKSANYEHYYNVWSGGMGRPGRSANLWTMVQGPNHLPIVPSIEIMNIGGMSSVAISRHIILSVKGKDIFEVIFMGQSMGVLKDGTLTLDFPTLPLSKLCEAELHGVMQ